jgi:hypothetical protein
MYMIYKYTYIYIYIYIYYAHFLMYLSVYVRMTPFGSWQDCQQRLVVVVVTRLTPNLDSDSDSHIQTQTQTVFILDFETDRRSRSKARKAGLSRAPGCGGGNSD